MINNLDYINLILIKVFHVMFNWVKSSTVNTKKQKETDQPFFATEEKKK